MKPYVVAIVPSAGVGRRFGGAVKKTFVDLKGTPLLVHTLSRLSDIEFISEIIPVLREDDIAMGWELISKYKLDKVRQIAPGGSERQDSINNALKLIDDKCIVMVHDGARPVISGGLVKDLFDNFEGIDGVVPGLAVKETLKEVDADSMVVSTVDREKFRSIQTPQVFRADVLKRAYDEAYSAGFYGTDDASLVERAGGRIKVIEGDLYNIKVTTPEDLDIVALMINRIDG
jgi:2-C-methyl-D-erythritol 4-phosphate cytidylyltransferase